MCALADGRWNLTRPPPSARRRAFAGIAAGTAAWIAALIGALPITDARADSSLPWTPSLVGRHRLALLVDEARLQLPLGQWPLPRLAVTRALQALPAELPAPLDDARAELQAELRQADDASLSLTLHNTSETLVGFGDDGDRQSHAALRTPAYGSAKLAARLGLRLERHHGDPAGPRVTLDGSAVAAEALGVQLQAWSHRLWWGPGWQNSLVLGNNAPALAGAGLQRAEVLPSASPWLAWLGAWNAQFFVARLGGVDEPAHPLLVGTRLSARPFDGFEIGFSRTAQWGGRGRQRDQRSFIRMLVGDGLNPDTPDEQARDPANEMAGIDMRARCPFGWRCAPYLQIIGEDEAGRFPAKKLGLYGVEWWSADGRQRGFVEYAATACDAAFGAALRGCAYRNYAYPGGYTQQQRWLGAAIGPDSRVLTLGWLHAPSASSVRLHYGRIGSRIGTFSPTVDDPAWSGRIAGASAQTTLQWGRFSVQPELAWTRVRAALRTACDTRIGLTLHTGLGDAPAP